MGSGCGVAVGYGVTVDGNRMRVGVGCGVAVGATVGVFWKVTGMAVATMGASVTVRIAAIAVTTQASTICWVSASDGLAAAQPSAPVEITITPTIQKTRVHCKYMALL